MYDELIKRLRDKARSDRKIKSNYIGLLLLQAADAIEQLCGLCASQSKDCSEAVAKCLELWAKQPRWIPVTERLPDEDGRYLVSYPLFNIEACMQVAYFSTNLYYMDRYAFPGKKYKRPGFYYSDDEYGDVELKDITHWMPLPEPPKEG